MMVFEFGKNSEKKLIDGLDFKCRQNAKATDPDWKQYYIDDCESPAEEEFLEALIAEYNLLPDYGVLRSPELVCEMQFKFHHYRFDFLLNGRLVVEIDGATYHSSPEAVERDRIRDAYSVDNKFTVLRIPASIVFKQPITAISRVKTALANLNLPVKEYEPCSAPEDTKSFLAHTGDAIGGFNKFLGSVSEFMDEVHDNVNRDITIKKKLSDYVQQMQTECSQLERLDLFCDGLLKFIHLINRRLEYHFTEDELTDTALMMRYVNESDYMKGAKFSYSVPEIIWFEAVTPNFDVNEPFHAELVEGVKAERAKRHLLVKKIFDRCQADLYYRVYIRFYLNKTQCPSLTSLEIAGSVDYYRHYKKHNDIVSGDDGRVKLNIPVRMSGEKFYESLNVSAEQQETFIKSILDSFYADIKLEADQIQFALDFAQNMIDHPDVYKLEAVKSITWHGINIPSDVMNTSINDILQSEVTHAINQRTKNMKIVFDSCQGNMNFMFKFTKVLIAMNCPIGVGKKISTGLYKVMYQNAFKEQK